VPKFFASHVLFFLLLLAPFNALTQTSNQVARKFDEFGDIQYSDLIARLDNFAVLIQDEPTSKGFIFVYRTRRDLPGLSNRLALLSKKYLTTSRGLSDDRVVTIDGGVGPCLTQELWIVPAGTTPKVRRDAYPRGLSYFAPKKFDELSFSLPSDMNESGSIDGSDDPKIYLEGFADELRREARSRGYIIVYGEYYIERGSVGDAKGRQKEYARPRLDSPVTARLTLRQIQNALINTYHIPMRRISLVDGGYRKVRSIELWIVPRGEHPPIPTPNSFPRERALSRR